MPWFQVFFALLFVVFVCIKKILRIKAATATTIKAIATSKVDRWKEKEALSGGERRKKI